MRRLLSTFTAALVALCMADAADAQTLGFKLGASFANFDVDEPDAGTSGITGFAGGGFLRFGSGMLGLQGELLSVTKGTDFDDPTGDDDIDFRIEYIEIPILLHASLMPGSRFSPYLFAGPTIALEVSCDVEFDSTKADCDDADTFNRKSTDFGIAGGGGITIPMGPGSILIEARYTYGLTDIHDNETGPSIKNRAAYLMAGYSIPLVRAF